MSDRHIGFIGTGQIGEPMVIRLLESGRRVSVYARRSDVRDRLATAGATIVAALDDLADVEVLAGCLFNDDQVSEVLTPLVSRLPAGAVVYSHTTGSPSTVMRLAEIGAVRGVAVVDAPFSGNAKAVRAGQLTVMLGGDPDAVAVAEETVGAYAGTILRTGPLGSALSAKLLNNLLFAACTQLTLTALNSAASTGIDEADFLSILDNSSGGSTAARYIAAAQVPAARFAEGLPRYLSKDVATAVSVAEAIGLDIEPLVAATQLGPMELAPQSNSPAART